MRLAAMLLLSALTAAPGAELWVAPDGDDAGPGTEAAPFATPARAMLAARGHRGEPVTVILRGGVYRLAQPLRFTPADSGSADAPVIWRAADGERPILSGGVALTGWQAADGRWTLELPQVAAGNWRLSQLWVDGQRRYRPRAAGGRYLTIAGAAAPDDRFPGTGHNRFRYHAGDIDPGWHRLGDVELLPFHSWSMSRLPIDAVDAERRVVTGHGKTWNDRLASLPAGRRYLVENVAEELDEAGEWYLDRGTGRLTYLPLPGEDPATTEVVAPRLPRLVEFTGDPDLGAWVEHLTFQGLAFHHTNWNVPQRGYSTAQAESVLGAAITAKGARDVAFEGCEVAHVGEYAIEWAAGCRDGRVADCELYDLGAGGVKIGTAAAPGQGVDDADLTQNIAVVDNLIAHGGRMHPAAVGVWIGHSPHNTVEHNTIVDFYYTGISVGWRWSYGPSHAHHNRIHANHIYDIGQERLDDLGGIYTLGESPGSVISLNHIHDVTRVDYGGSGVYLDQASSDMVIEDNLTYDTEDSGFTMHWGARNTVRNNIFAYGETRQISPGRVDLSGPLTFERNLVYAPHGDLFASRPLPADHDYDHNVYWTLGEGPLKWAKGVDLAAWRAEGQDEHSLIADPLFVDPEHRDFRLRPESPAFKIGFEPFDITAAGRRTPTRAYATAPDVPHAYPPAAAPGPQPLDDDFELMAAGERPLGAAHFENNDQESIRVSDETAASGRFSLKFVDGPSEPSYNPHLHYKPGFHQGVLEGGFAARVEPGAVMEYAWRDWPSGSPIVAGPLIRVTGDGALLAAGQERMRVPLGEWVVYTVSAGLGEQADGTWDLTVEVPGQAPRRFEDLPTDAGFDRIDWLGWIAGAAQPAVFYLDDVWLRPRD